MFQTHVLNVSSVFKRMLQVLYLDVSKLDRVLHLPHRFLLPRLGVSSSPSAEGASGAGGWDTPGDCGTDVSARSPLLLRGQVAHQFPLIFYFYAGC